MMWWPIRRPRPNVEITVGVTWEADGRACLTLCRGGEVFERIRFKPGPLRELIAALSNPPRQINRKDPYFAIGSSSIAGSSWPIIMDGPKFYGVIAIPHPDWFPDHPWVKTDLETFDYLALRTVQISGGGGGSADGSGTGFEYRGRSGVLLVKRESTRSPFGPWVHSYYHRPDLIKATGIKIKGDDDGKAAGVSGDNAGPEHEGVDRETEQRGDADPGKDAPLP